MKTSTSISHDGKQQGFTLIELIVIIVVIGVGLAGLTIAIQQATKGSTNPLFKQQANAIAQSYLEEVMLKSFCDPDDFASTGDLCMTSCITSACTAPICSGTGGGTETRPTYDDVCDYAGLSDSGATDQAGNAIVGLEAYTVTVSVIDGAAANFGGLSATAGEVMRIDVNVQHSNGASSALSGYRANY